MHKLVAGALFLCLSSCRRESAPDDTPYSPPRDPAQDYAPAATKAGVKRPSGQTCERNCCTLGADSIQKDFDGCDLAHVWGCDMHPIAGTPAEYMPPTPSRFSSCRETTFHGAHVVFYCCPF